MRWQLPHSFLVNSKKTNFPSRPALWIASSTLVAQIVLPGPIPVGSAIFGEASETAAVGAGRGLPGAFEGAAAGAGAARAAKRTIGRRELKTDLQPSSGCCVRNGPAESAIPRSGPENMVPRDGIEPPTQGFSVPCSTN